jgi:hypothetical protein
MPFNKTNPGGSRSNCQEAGITIRGKGVYHQVNLSRYLYNKFKIFWKLSLGY